MFKLVTQRFIKFDNGHPIIALTGCRSPLTDFIMSFSEHCKSKNVRNLGSRFECPSISIRYIFPRISAELTFLIVKCPNFSSLFYCQMFLLAKILLPIRASRAHTKNDILQKFLLQVIKGALVGTKLIRT